MSEYRVGMVGCGGISRVHAKAYQATENTEIVCCADINPQAVNKFGEEFSIPENARYLSHEAMLDAEELDLVSVCTWHEPHAPITIDACKAGVKGILCEKPMATSLGDADAMLEAAAASGAKIAVGHQGRFRPANMTARQLVLSGAIGQPTAAFRQSDGGLLNNGTHAIDGVRYLLGDPKAEWVMGQLSRHTDKWERRIRIEDCCVGVVCFEGGTRFVMESDMPKPGTSGPIIYGTEGSIRISDGVVYLMNGDKAGWQEIKAGQPIEKPEEATMQAGWSAPAESSPTQVAELIAWIEGRIEEHRGAGRHGRNTVEIMMAIYESLRIQNVVNLPLETKESPLELMIDDGTLPVTKPGKYDIRAPF
ncbi:Gfo/Idh/MocA family protein [Candidatus Poribacteria bacterium]